MKKSLRHLPKHKREELEAITSIIRENAPVEMLILFGSHARKDWVEDRYEEDGIIYEYMSDYDLLAVTEERKTARHVGLWSKVDRKIRTSRVSRTWTSVIVHDIAELNKGLINGNYFFADVYKEGIMLYDSKAHKLKRPGQLNPAQRLKNAEQDFKNWYKSARQFYATCIHHMEKRWYKKAAFELHQSVENLYATLLLVFTGYKPKLHNLEKLGHRVSRFDGELLSIFPRATDEEDRLFKLLLKAYIDARYKKTYKITRKELDYLSKRVRKLQRLTRKLCKQKIESLAV